MTCTCGLEMIAIATYITKIDYPPEYEIVSEPMIETKYTCSCGKKIYLWTKVENEVIY